MTRLRLFRLLVGVCLIAGTVRPALAHSDTQASQPTAGVVVDRQRAVIARAHVRLVDDRGRMVAATMTDDQGRFVFPSAACQGCRIEVSLAGFVTASVEPARATDTTVVLDLAPVTEVVMVSATRDEAPASQVASSKTAFTADDIDRRGVPLVSDLLRAAPGVTVVGTGGPGGSTSLFVRGGSSNYNKVLLDGIPLNEPGGTFNFGSLTTTSLERVELVRGAQSALFGSDAMSSVVQLFTRRGRAGDGRPNLTVAWEGGSHDSQRFEAGVSGGAGRADYAIAASRFDTAGHVENNDLDTTTVSWNVGLPLASAWSLRAIGRFDDQRVGTPGQTAFGRPDLDAAFDRRDVAAGFKAEHRAPTLTGRAVYAYTRSTQTSTNLVEDPPYTPAYDGRTSPFEFYDFLYDDRNVLSRHHLSYQADWRPDDAGSSPVRQFVTAALDYDAERATLENRIGDTSLPASRDNVGLAGQYQLVSRRVSLVAGLRVESNDSFGTAVVPRVSIGWTLRDGSGRVGRLVLKGNAGRGVKEPTILQSFSQSPFFLGNPDLEPEWATTADIGVEQRLARDRVKVDVVWFDNRYRNQIALRTVDVTTFTTQFFNIGETRARGLELEVETAPADGWRARGGYTFLASEIIESTSAFSPVFAEGQWVFRQPRHSGFVEVGWQRGPARVDLFGLFAGRRVDSDFSALEPPMVEGDAYATWALTAAYRVRSPFEVFLRLENLTGSLHMEPLGYPVWGRAAHAGVRVLF